MDGMKRTRVIIAAFLVAGAILAFALPERGTPLSLIRISKDSASSWRALTRLEIDIRQELETCFLAMADREDTTLLRRNRIPFKVLLRNAGKREILIVGTASPDAFAALGAAGTAVAVEPGTAVFWTETGSAAETVPAGLPRKVLATRSVFRYAGFPPAAGPAPPVSASQDSLVETIVSLVSVANLSSSVQSLQDFMTRYASTTNCEASGEYLYGAFSALGLDDVHFEPFTFSTYTSRNVVAEKTGETYPDDIFIICAHYDSTSPDRLTLAPGADDNASGTAAVLEAARILAAFPLDFTVRFIAFSAEEWGLYGSQAYATAARQAGERIIGVVNLDMIAYADALPEDLQIIVNGPSTWLANLFLGAAASYGIVGATMTVDASIVYSDHSPFWDNGYPALLAIEDYPLNNPYYHETPDTLDKLNLEFFTTATRASLGLLAGLAQPIRDGYPLTPVGLTATSTAYSSLFNSLKTVYLTWAPVAGAVGYNVYRTNVTHLGYVKFNDAPIAGTSFSDADVDTDRTYYYVVTALGATGLESNRSREVAVTPDFSFSSSTALSPSLLTIWRLR
jgi:hypothetical protein